MEEFIVSYLLVRSLMTFQSRGKILSFIRFLNTHKIFSKNSWRQRTRGEDRGGVSESVTFKQLSSTYAKTRKYGQAVVLYVMFIPINPLTTLYGWLILKFVMLVAQWQDVELSFSYLELLLALKVFHQVLEVDIGHLAEEGKEAGHVLSLSIGTQG